MLSLYMDVTRISSRNEQEVQAFFLPFYARSVWLWRSSAYTLMARTAWQHHASMKRNIGPILDDIIQAIFNITTHHSRAHTLLRGGSIWTQRTLSETRPLPHQLEVQIIRTNGQTLPLPRKVVLKLRVIHQFVETSVFKEAFASRSIDDVVQDVLHATALLEI